MVKKHFIDIDFTIEPYKSMVVKEYPEESKRVIRFYAYCFLSGKTNQSGQLSFNDDDYLEYVEKYEGIKNHTPDVDLVELFNLMLPK